MSNIIKNITLSLALAFPAYAQQEAPPTEPAAEPVDAPPAEPTYAPVAPVTPWSWVGIAGGALAGVGLGTIAVATVVLLDEPESTDVTKRTIELVSGGALIVVGGGLIALDGLTE